jgi:hypothetical protein
MGNKNSLGLGVAVLWTALLMGMLYHFMVAAMPLFYGIDVAVPSLKGTDPGGGAWLTVLLGTVYLALITLPVLLKSVFYRWVNFVIAVVMVIFNFWHLAEHAMEGIAAYQIVLLTSTVIVNVALAAVSFRWVRIKEQP